MSARTSTNPSKGRWKKRSRAKTAGRDHWAEGRTSEMNLTGRVTFAIALAFLFSCADSGGKTGIRTKTLVLTHATVIDATGAPPQSDMTVIVTGDRITAIEKTSQSHIPKGASVVNARGKYLIPGLWDMHVHLDGLEPIEEAPEILVSYGITRVRDMGGHWERLQSLRSSFHNGLRVGPSIYMAGFFIEGEQGADFHLVL